MLYIGNKNYTNCCVLGYHGAGIVPGYSTGPGNGQGNNAVQTYIYAAWSTPGSYSGFLTDYTGARSAPSPTRGLADIHALSHEVSEWLDDPYVNNAVQYGCTGGGIEPVLGPAYNSYLTFMGPLTTGLGGGYAGFGSYAQGC